MTAAATAESGGAAIAVGITGHRLERLARADLAGLRARLDAVMRALEGAAPGTRFRLVGSLAEGADMLAADAALGRGWQLDTVLPFAQGDYARDFDPAGATDLRDRLRESANVLELPGSRDEPGGEAAAYERAGRVVLMQCDILIAVWDGDSPRGRGGAAQIVGEAVAHAIPVLVLDPDAQRSPVLLWSGLNAHGSGPEAVDTVARGGLDDLPALLARIGSLAPRKSGRLARGRMRAAPPLFAVAYPPSGGGAGQGRSGSHVRDRARRGTARPQSKAQRPHPPSKMRGQFMMTCSAESS